MRKQLLYRDLAEYYDLIYSARDKDYEKESEDLKKIILRHKKTKGKRLVDVACGTGRHLGYLKKYFSCIGVDINKEIIKIARRKVKGVKFKKASMVTMRLNKKFDVITCLFSSIGYVKTYSNLRKTLSNFSDHMVEGGVLVIEPWLNEKVYKVGSPHLTVYDGKDVKIARANISKKKGNISILDMHYLIAERDKDVKYFSDRHELGMFKVDKFLKIMKNSGFEVKFIKKGLGQNERGLYLGIKK